MNLVSLRINMHSLKKIANLISFQFLICLSGSIAHGLALSTLCLDFRKAFGTVSHVKYVTSVKRYWLDHGNIRCFWNRLNDQGQRLVFNELIPSNLDERVIIGRVSNSKIKKH